MARSDERRRDAHARSHAPRRDAAMILVVSLGCWLPSLPGGFVYDDGPLIEQNERIRSPANLRAIWLTDWWAGRRGDTFVPNPHRDRLYRPLTLQTLALDRAVWGLHPAGYHAVNVLLNAVAALLVWRLATRWWGDARAGLWAGLIFAIHPAHAEAVCMVVGRAEILAALGTLAGLLILGTRPPTPGRAATACAAFLAAVLGKESAIVFPALAALWVVRFDLWRRAGARQRGLLLAAVIVPLLLYFPLRYAALEGQLIRPAVRDLVNNPLAGVEGWLRIAGLLTVFGHYLRLLIVPRVLSCDYGLAVIDPARGPDAMTFVGAGGVIALASLLLLWRRRPASRRAAGPAAAEPSWWPLLGGMLAMFVFAYAPASNVLLLNVAVGERLIYLPSAFFLTALAGAAGRACDTRRGGYSRSQSAATLFCVVLAVFAARSVVRQFDWRSNHTLFLTDVRTFPQSLRLNTMCGELLRRDALRTPDPAAQARLLREAQAFLEAALEINGRDAVALKYLALVFEAQGRRAQARLLLERAAALNPTDPELLAGLRRTSPTGSAPQPERIASLQRRLASRPADTALRATLARALLDAGRPAEALRTIEQAPAAQQSEPRLLELRAEALLLLMRDEEAAEAYRQLVRVAPQHWQAHANLARLLAERDPQAALEHARIAARLRPDDVRVQVNLAEALAINDRRAEALRLYRRLLERIPASDPLRAAIADRIRELGGRP